MKERYTYKGVTVEAVPVGNQRTTCKRCAMSVSSSICNTEKCANFKVKDCVYGRNGDIVIFRVVKARKLTAREQNWRAFRKFLFDNDALTKYDRNIRSYCKSYGITVNKQKSTFAENMYDALLGAFTWSDAPEKLSFWIVLDREWQQIVDSK